MRKSTIVLLLIGFIVCGVAGRGSPPVKEQPDSEIQVIMKAGFGGYPPTVERPIKRAVDGKATKEDLDRLLKLCEELNKATPPRGDADEWKKRTEELTKSVKAVMDKSNDETLGQLKKASNCKACHDKFQPAK